MSLIWQLTDDSEPVELVPVLYCLLVFLAAAELEGNGSKLRTGASIAWGIHFRSVMALNARSNPSRTICDSTPWRVSDVTEKGDPEPHEISVGFGSGLAATASALLASRAVARAAKVKSRIMWY